MFILPVVKDHLSWETTKFGGCFIQVKLYFSHCRTFLFLCFFNPEKIVLLLVTVRIGVRPRVLLRYLAQELQRKLWHWTGWKGNFSMITLNNILHTSNRYFRKFYILTYCGLLMPHNLNQYWPLNEVFYAWHLSDSNFTTTSAQATIL